MTTGAELPDDDYLMTTRKQQILTHVLQSFEIFINNKSTKKRKNKTRTSRTNDTNTCSCLK